MFTCVLSYHDISLLSCMNVIIVQVCPLFKIQKNITPRLCFIICYQCHFQVHSLTFIMAINFLKCFSTYIFNIMLSIIVLKHSYHVCNRLYQFYAQSSVLSQASKFYVFFLTLLNTKFVHNLSFVLLAIRSCLLPPCLFVSIFDLHYGLNQY